MSAGPHPKQLMRRMTVNFAAPTHFDAARLESWQPYWEDATFPFARPNVTADSPAKDALTTQWIENVLRTTRDLMLASNLPCFAHMRVLNWAPLNADSPADSIAVRADIELPVFESYARGMMNVALNEALSCVAFMLAHEPTPDRREELWAKIIETSTPRIVRDNRVNPASFRVLQTACEKGIPFTHLGLSVYQLGWGAAGRIVNRSTGSDDPAYSVRLTMFKQVNAALLRRAGLPAPNHILVTTIEDARDAAEKIGWPLVVKPADLERGEGVATDVQPDTVDDAVKTALELSPTSRVLIEQQVPGICYRIFVTGGRMLYAIKRNPMGVFGDGKKTVAELVQDELDAQALKPKWTRRKIQPLDDLARASIDAAGFSETSVPDAKQFVPLRPIESTAWGGTGEEVTDQIHPENVRIAIAATALCGLNTAGVDIITDDISRPWTETGAIINEVNFSPALGGSDVSRGHLPEYVDRLMQGTGLIPVTVFVGDEAAADAAKSHVQTWRKQGVSGVVTTATQTWNAEGAQVPVALNGLSARVRALILDRSVEALAIVVQTDALLDGPLPLEGVDEVRFINDPDIRGPEDTRNARKEALTQRLTNWAWDQNV